MIRLAALLVVWAATASNAQQDGGVTAFSQGDPVMNAAIAAAQRSLPLFLCSSVDEDGYGPTEGFLKVRVPVKDPNTGHEIIWVGPFAAWDGREFSGILANEPVAMPGFSLGDQLDFTYPDIVDWAWFHPNGQRYGDYTTRVILDQMDDKAALAALADPPYPSTWTCN